MMVAKKKPRPKRWVIEMEDEKGVATVVVHCIASDREDATEAAKRYLPNAIWEPIERDDEGLI